MASVGARVTLSLAAIAGAFALTFVAGAPPEHCPEVSVDDLEAASTETVEWFVRNQEADGTWLYEYHRTGGPVDTNYNIVRHAGVMSGLYQAANAGIPDALESADRGLEWAEDLLVDVTVDGDDVAGSGGVAMTDSNSVKAGTSALLLSALIERRQVTGEETYDDLARDLGRFLVGQVEPSGAFLGTYDLRAGAPVPDSYSKYYTGEAYWALARLHTLFPDEGWGEAADRIGHYLATARDDAEDLFPPIADHWAGYGLAETVSFPERPAGEPLTDAELEYTRRQAGLFGAQVRFLAQRFSPWGAAVRTPLEPRGGGYGVLGEGLTGLWLTARADERLDDLDETIADRTVCNAALTIEKQADAEEAAGYDEPDKVRGAWFRDDVTRMDDMQHALSALLRTVPVVEADDLADGDGSREQAPSVWLWLPLLVLALNPARGALGVPREGRRREEVIRLAAVGGAIGGAVVAVVGLLGWWFVDVIDVSDSSLRIAAGAVAVLGGIADLFRPSPSPDPSLPGTRAALVPVALPLVIRPALLVLAVSATADHGWWLTVVGVLAAVGIFVGATPVAAPDGVPGRVGRWVARVAGVLVAAGGVLLIVNGVLDI